MILSRSVKDCNQQHVGTVVFLSDNEGGASAYLRVMADGMEHLFEIPWHMVGANYRSHCFTLKMSKEELLEALELTVPDGSVLHGAC